MLWNFVTQPEAATASREMYKSTKFTSDLLNSYAWDTAILFIQNFGQSNYSSQNSKNTMLANTGANGDLQCNINDMASNVAEWVTETCSGNFPCVFRGGFSGANDNYKTSVRAVFGNTDLDSRLAFRPILYL